MQFNGGHVFKRPEPGEIFLVELIFRHDFVGSGLRQIVIIHTFLPFEKAR
jgi:hypothetical protein